MIVICNLESGFIVENLLGVENASTKMTFKSVFSSIFSLKMIYNMCHINFFQKDITPTFHANQLSTLRIVKRSHEK